jgi:hypothetical protein
MDCCATARYEHYDPIPRYTIPRTAHCEGGAQPWLR